MLGHQAIPEDPSDFLVGWTPDAADELTMLVFLTMTAAVVLSSRVP